MLTYEKIAEPTIGGLENPTDIQDDFRYKFFTRDETEREERRNQKIELREIAKQEAAKRGKVIDDSKKNVNHF